MNNPFSAVRRFTIETTDELKKATWPTALELRDSTIVVIAATLILGIFTAISDFSLYQVVNMFTRWVS